MTKGFFLCRYRFIVSFSLRSDFVSCISHCNGHATISVDGGCTVGVDGVNVDAITVNNVRGSLEDKI